MRGICGRKEESSMRTRIAAYVIFAIAAPIGFAIVVIVVARGFARETLRVLRRGL